VSKGFTDLTNIIALADADLLLAHQGTLDAVVSLSTVRAAVLGISGGNINLGGNTVVSGNITVSGNLTVSGTTTQVNTTQLTINDNVVTLNSGFSGTPPSTLVSGIEVNRGSLAKYDFQFEELTQSFKIGMVGSLQKVATREDTPINQAYVHWDAASFSLKTSTDFLVPTVASTTNNAMWLE
jgi:hypothetical protein